MKVIEKIRGKLEKIPKLGEFVSDLEDTKLTLILAVFFTLFIVLCLISNNWVLIILAIAIIFLSFFVDFQFKLAEKNETNQISKPLSSDLKMKYLDLWTLVSHTTTEALLNLEVEVKDSLSLYIQVDDNYLFSFDSYVKLLAGEREPTQFEKCSCLIVSLMKNPKICSHKLDVEELTSSEFEQLREFNFKLAIKCVCEILNFSEEYILNNSERYDILYHGATLASNGSSSPEVKSIMLMIYTDLLRSSSFH